MKNNNKKISVKCKWLIPISIVLLTNYNFQLKNVEAAEDDINKKDIIDVHVHQKDALKLESNEEEIKIDEKNNVDSRLHNKISNESQYSYTPMKNAKIGR